MTIFLHLFSSPKSLIIVISTFVCITFATEFVQPMFEGPTKAPIGCHLRSYYYEVKRELKFNENCDRKLCENLTESDDKGLSCWDTIEVKGCWGRCDSKEISDWKFPFKKSHHPVCIPAGRTKAHVMLKNCDADAGDDAKKYDYTEPTSCICQVCTSSDTSCEYPQQRGGKAQITFGSDDLLNADYSSLVGRRI